MMGDSTGIMRPWIIALLLPLATVGSGEIADAIAAAPRAAPVAPAADLEAARALFEKNLDAIRRHDRDAYLACYLNADTLAPNRARRARPPTAPRPPPRRERRLRRGRWSARRSWTGPAPLPFPTRR